MRRRSRDTHENHDRWLVSYADFITLLFAFFVVMFASTQDDKLKARAVSESVKDALEHGPFSNTLSTVLGRGKHENSKPPVNPERVKESDNLPPQTAPPPPILRPPPADLAKSMATLERGLDGELKAGKIGLKLEGRGLVVSLREATFFASGDDAVAPGSDGILAKIAAEIQKFSNPVRLEGHTDSQPIHNSRFRSNWELSVARSIAMLELLQRKFGIAPDRLSVAGYAENAPVETNDNDEGRARNRRVDLVILSDEAVKSEPGAENAAPRK
jgi:chemotaxis protein MotB